MGAVPVGAGDSTPDHAAPAPRADAEVAVDAAEGAAHGTPMPMPMTPPDTTAPIEMSIVRA